MKVEKGDGFMSIETPNDVEAGADPKRAKTRRRVTGKTMDDLTEAEEEDSPSCPKTKPKAKAKQKLPEGFPEMCGKGKGQSRREVQSRSDVEERDVERISDWVRDKNLTGLLDDFKSSL